MKALFTLSPDHKRLLVGLSLVSILSLFVPHLSLAADMQASGQDKLLVFEVTNSNTKLIENQTSSVSYQDLVQSDPLVTRLTAYLEDKNSPLAQDAAHIVTRPHWQRALAISVVESNMCRFTPKYVSHGKVMESHNCSGIGGDNFKRYASYEEWFDDMTALLDKPNYVNRPIEKFIGYYVVPGSSSWLYGVRKTEAELAGLQQLAKADRVAQTGSPTAIPVTASVNDRPILAKLK